MIILDSNSSYRDVKFHFSFITRQVLQEEIYSNTVRIVEYSNGIQTVEYLNGIRTNQVFDFLVIEYLSRQVFEQYSNSIRHVFVTFEYRNSRTSQSRLEHTRRASNWRCRSLKNRPLGNNPAFDLKFYRGPPLAGAIHRNEGFRLRLAPGRCFCAFLGRVRSTSALARSLARPRPPSSCFEPETMGLVSTFIPSPLIRSS